MGQRSQRLLRESSLNLSTLPSLTKSQDAWGRVCPVTDDNGHRFVIKSVVKGSPELTNVKTLLDLPSPRNHTVPAEVIDCEKTSLIVMPWLSSVKFLWWMNLDLDTLNMLFGQIIEVGQ